MTSTLSNLAANEHAADLIRAAERGSIARRLTRFESQRLGFTALVILRFRRRDAAPARPAPLTARPRTARHDG
jgi:hypothetical protein